MLGVSHSINRIKTMVLVISLLVTGVTFSNAEDADEHIHQAQAVMNQVYINNVNTNSVRFTLQTLDTSIEFSLETNTRLLGSAFTLDDNITLYRGKILGKENSWARFTRTNGIIEGAFFDGNDLFMVEQYTEVASMLHYNALNHQESSHVLSNDSASVIINVEDIESSGTCGLHNDEINSEQFNIEMNQNSFDYNFYVDELNEMLGGQVEKEIQISLFADVQFVSSSDDATAEMLALLNIADGIYREQIGVQFVLTEVNELSDNGTLTSTNATNLIIAFRNSGFSNPGVSHLFTGKNLDGTTVGIAYVGSLCRNSSVGVTQKYGSKTAIIFAHELGHNFGSPHDNESGSACSSTPSGYIMNPNVNSGGSTFSSCSVEQILPVVEQAIGNCIAEISAIAPSITSVANLEASIGIDYMYDANGTVEADGTAPFTYSLDIAPEGMSINDNGVVTWLPTTSNIGVNTVQIRVANEVGSDIQIFDISISEPNPSINFEEVSTSSFAEQDETKSFRVGDNPYELELTGNTWRSIPFNYIVTPDTVIEFDFKSDSEGEIHGIAFENDNEVSPETSFKIFGTQKWGINAVIYSTTGSIQTISIPVGQFIEGDFDRLVFIMDEDKYGDRANSVFSNVNVFEAEEDTTFAVDFNAIQISSFKPGFQDLTGDVEIIEQGKGIKIEGNAWKKIVLDSVSISSKTILKFEFKSDRIGEIHGLGFFKNDEIDRANAIQLAGTQNWGITDFVYTNEGEWQSFTIAIGEYFPVERPEIVFIMDQDKDTGNSIVSDSSFRNIQFLTEK
jgi:hypothetical protein